MAIKLTAQASRNERERRAFEINQHLQHVTNDMIKACTFMDWVVNRSDCRTQAQTHACHIIVHLEFIDASVWWARIFSTLRLKYPSANATKRFITIIDRCMCMCLCSIAGGFCAVKIYSFQVARWSLALFSPFVRYTDNHEHRFWCKRWIRCH